jgi:nucleoside-diphosphate-sugar epimerase
MGDLQHILITGGAGYLGSVLTNTLLDRGYFVTVVDKLLHGGEHLLHPLQNDHFYFSKMDVGEPGVLEEVTAQAMEKGAPPLHAVVHLAAIVGFPACKNVGDQEAWRNNVDAVKYAFESSEQLGAKRFIFSSTYSVYGLATDGRPVSENSSLHPQSLYGETKIAAEDYLQECAKDSSCSPLIFRFATAFGPSPRMRFDLIINQFVLEAFARGELVIFQKNYSRSFAHVMDIVEGIHLGLELPKDTFRGEVFNLGSQDGNFTKEEIVQLLCKILPETKVRYEDLSFSGDMRDVQVSFQKIQEKLKFQAKKSVEDGILEVMDILKSGIIQDPFADRYRNARLEIQ